ncbi:MAG: hypothetical protein MUO26_08970 [Methanotrichaceae archaeon]|nr:hypothetical protein [Methanotrichaceae archaeon]
MLSERYLVIRSQDDMQQEVKNLLADSERLRTEFDFAIEKEADLRNESVETRHENPKLAEMLWQEAENLHLDSREILRQSVEKRLLAAEIQHQIEVRTQIESLNIPLSHN